MRSVSTHENPSTVTAQKASATLIQSAVKVRQTKVGSSIMTDDRTNAFWNEIALWLGYSDGGFPDLRTKNNKNVNWHRNGLPCLNQDSWSSSVTFSCHSYFSICCPSPNISPVISGGLEPSTVEHVITGLRIFFQRTSLISVTNIAIACR